MMKIFGGLLLCLLFFVFLVPAVFAQELTSEKAYSDYIYTYNKYRESETQFVTAKQSYLNYQTLNSKNEAQTKTLQMLQLRDETVTTYLTTLRMKLAEVTQVSDYNLNTIYLKLDDEIKWYNNHNSSLTGAGTIEDLIKLSTKAEEQYNSTEKLIYKTLFAIESYKEKKLSDSIGLQITTIKNKLAEIRNNGNKNITKADRWVLEADNRLTQSLNKQKSADILINGDKSQYGDIAKTYYDTQFQLEESNQYLKETNSYLKEVLREIKSAD